MRLEHAIYPVRDLAWGDVTRLENSQLRVDRGELKARLLEDARLAAVDLQIIRVGESCRVGPVFDIVEPRCKLDGAGVDFPGVLGPLESVGEGVTGVLRGMAVTILHSELSDARPVLELQPAALSDGGDAVPTCYSDVVHLVIVPTLAPELEPNERLHTLRTAVLRAGVWLARSACRGEPARRDLFDLGGTGIGASESGAVGTGSRTLQSAPIEDPIEGEGANAELPRVAYVFQIHSHQHPTVVGEPLLYGDNARHLLPTILHPNEVLDGAVLPGYGSMGIETYSVQNHAVILDLYRRHGHDLNFVGVVITVAHQTIAERERAKIIASNLVKYTLAADGVVLSKSGGGAPHVDMAEVAHRCEQLGVRTALLAWEISSEGDATEGSALFNYPDLDAVANVGSNGFAFALPPAERVITLPGKDDLERRLRGPIRINANYLCGMMDQLGGGRLVATRY